VRRGWGWLVLREKRWLVLGEELWRRLVLREGRRRLVLREHRIRAVEAVEPDQARRGQDGDRDRSPHWEPM
jgi:hypothetical protein